MKGSAKIIVKVVDIYDKEKWAQKGTLWDTT